MIDRRAWLIILHVLDMEQKEFAEHMGYGPGYLVNVLTGQTRVHAPFRRAFGDTLATLILGPAAQQLRAERYPAGPLVELIERRALEAPSKRWFYEDLGISTTWKKRDTFSGIDVDRLCCALGVNPVDLYPNFIDDNKEVGP